MSSPPKEICDWCEEPTGRAGKGEDSLYIEDEGPYCECCLQNLLLEKWGGCSCMNNPPCGFCENGGVSV